MYKNIEFLIKNGYTILISEDLEKEGFYVTFDVDGSTYNPMSKLLDGIQADKLFHQTYINTIIQIRKIYKDYPLVHTSTKERGLEKVDEKAEKWLHDYSLMQRKIICENIKSMVMRIPTQREINVQEKNNREFEPVDLKLENKRKQEFLHYLKKAGY